MFEFLKNKIKLNIPSRVIELFTKRGISITKIPKKNAFISDLFLLRVEESWETYFECLNMQALLNPEEKNNKQTIEIVFFDYKGCYINKTNINLNFSLKTTLNIKKISNDLGIFNDGLFAVFHSIKKNWLLNHKSYLAERGYVGYANSKMGLIKGFVHGNLDAIAKLNKGYKFQLLGEYSFFEKKYFLQYSFKAGDRFQLFFVNSTSKIQEIQILETNTNYNNLDSQKIPPGGLYKYENSINSNSKSHIKIKSNVYLMRPTVFKIMENSFDVFHG